MQNRNSTNLLVGLTVTLLCFSSCYSKHRSYDVQSMRKAGDYKVHNRYTEDLQAQEDLDNANILALDE